jgi:hypothetical protein
VSAQRTRERRMEMRIYLRMHLEALRMIKIAHLSWIQERNGGMENTIVNLEAAIEKIKHSENVLISSI